VPSLLVQVFLDRHESRGKLTRKLLKALDIDLHPHALHLGQDVNQGTFQLGVKRPEALVAHAFG